MKWVHINIVLVISLSTVFAVQFGSKKNSNKSMSLNDSPLDLKVNRLPNQTSELSTNQQTNQSTNSLSPPNVPSKGIPDGTSIQDPGQRSNNTGTDASDDDVESNDSESEESAPSTRKDHQEHHEHHNSSTSIVSNDQNVNYILLVSYFRSGSSFVGDLLQQPGDTFYTFEPFKFFDFNHKVDADDEGEALRIIQNIFKCSFEDEEEYSDWICEDEKTINRNKFLWKSCESDRTNCCDPVYVDQICAKAALRVIKETRLSLESVDKILERLPKVKVIFLVRDPRAIYNTRRHYRWCKKTPCIDYEQLCNDLTSDLQVYPRLVEKYKNRVTIARLEDIALDPINKGQAIYNFLGLPWDTDTNENIIETMDSYPFVLNSRDTITKWVTKLNETIINSIQDSCKSVLEQLGYKTINLPEIDNYDDINRVYDNSYSLPYHL